MLHDWAVERPIYFVQIFVDEITCIGCTNCAGVCPKTFQMQWEEQGRARVIEQGIDHENDVQDAIDSCPVNCIHKWVSGYLMRHYINIATRPNWPKILINWGSCIVHIVLYGFLDVITSYRKTPYTQDSIWIEFVYEWHQSQLYKSGMFWITWAVSRRIGHLMLQNWFLIHRVHTVQPDQISGSTDCTNFNHCSSLK